LVGRTWRREGNCSNDLPRRKPWIISYRKATLARHAHNSPNVVNNTLTKFNFRKRVDPADAKWRLAGNHENFNRWMIAT